MDSINMAHPYTRKNIIQYLEVFLILILTIPFLYLKDAFAYGRCIDSGSCEFLDPAEIYEKGRPCRPGRQGQQETVHPTMSCTTFPPLPSLSVQKHYHLDLPPGKSLYFSTPRYKNLTCHELFLTPAFVPLWFWELRPSISKPFLPEIEDRLFYPFNQLVIDISVIIS